MSVSAANPPVLNLSLSLAKPAKCVLREPKRAWGGAPVKKSVEFPKK